MINKHQRDNVRRYLASWRAMPIDYPKNLLIETFDQIDELERSLNMTTGQDGSSITNQIPSVHPQHTIAAGTPEAVQIVEAAHKDAYRLEVVRCFNCGQPVDVNHAYRHGDVYFCDGCADPIEYERSGL